MYVVLEGQRPQSRKALYYLRDGHAMRPSKGITIGFACAHLLVLCAEIRRVGRHGLVYTQQDLGLGLGA